MGTFNGNCALAVSALAQKENKLLMVTGTHLPELTGVACNAHTFVFMPNARMMAQAVAPHIATAYGTRWYMITAATLDGKAAAQAMLWTQASPKASTLSGRRSRRSARSILRQL